MSETGVDRLARRGCSEAVLSVYGDYLANINHYNTRAASLTSRVLLSPSTMSSIRSLTLLSVAAVALATPLSTSPDGAAALRFDRTASIAPLNHPGVPASRVINDSYIVMFKDGVHPSAFDNHFNFLDQAHQAAPLDHDDSGLTHVWDAHVKGYAGYFSRDVVDAIRRQPEVDFVEHDQVVHALETQKMAPWVRLSRI